MRHSETTHGGVSQLVAFEFKGDPSLDARQASVATRIADWRAPAEMEREGLMRLDADLVVCEELEAGLEVAQGVLRRFGVGPAELQSFGDGAPTLEQPDGARVVQATGRVSAPQSWVVCTIATTG